MSEGRDRGKRESRYCYESPLSVFKKSLQELTSMVNDIVYHKDRRLTRGMLQNLNKQIACGIYDKEISSRNSVIVVNDSDSETTDENNDNETNKDKQNTSLSIIECTSKPSSCLKNKTKSRISNKLNKSTNRSSVIPNNDLNNDSSVLYLAEVQESFLNGENIAPTQTEDDVIELWSCLRKSNMNRSRKNAKRNHDDSTNAMFTIDTTPNLKYLKCLRTDTKETKKKKQNNLSMDKITYNSFTRLNKQVDKQVTSKYSDSGDNERKRQHDSNLDSSSTKSNAQYSKKKFNLDEKNSQTNSRHKLREIIVDGCNVAMTHTNGKKFSEKGIEIVVDYFKLRGHVVKVFLPHHVRRKEYVFLEQLYKEGTVVFTPSRNIDGRQITSYDDRYILKYATSCGGIVISTDQYRDLYKEKPEWRNTIVNRLLIPTFVGDYIMFPEDPLGRSGPNLETFLRH